MITPRDVPIDRVVIAASGEAACPRVAAAGGHVPALLFLRQDGWVLGAPAECSDVAYKLWADAWVAWGDLQSNRWYPAGQLPQRLTTDAPDDPTPEAER
jgi:hypothetical protein